MSRLGVTREEAGMMMEGDGGLSSGPGAQHFSGRGWAAWSDLSFR